MDQNIWLLEDKHSETGGNLFGQDLLGPMSLVYGFSPMLATLVPIAIAGSVGVVLLRRSG